VCDGILGYDFQVDGTWSPVVNMSKIRTVLALVASKCMRLDKIELTSKQTSWTKSTWNHHSSWDYQRGKCSAQLLRCQALKLPPGKSEMISCITIGSRGLSLS